MRADRNRPSPLPHQQVLEAYHQRSVIIRTENAHEDGTHATLGVRQMLARKRACRPPRGYPDPQHETLRMGRLSAPVLLRDESSSSSCGRLLSDTPHLKHQ